MTSIPKKSAIHHFKQGFSLFELMIAMVIIAILTAIAIPAYQNYIKKAAMTDMLQLSSPYRTAVEICFIESGELKSCQSGSNHIPPSKSSNYVSMISVNQGIITLAGKSSLSNLTVTLTPKTGQDGELNWVRSCSVQPSDSNLQSMCEDMFKE